MDVADKARLAAEYAGSRLTGKFPVGVVMGSGLGQSPLDPGDVISIPYERIPGFPVTTVAGHEGNLLAGSANGVPTLVMQGRFHLYEGYHMKDIILPLWTLQLLGVRTLILTNAAGGINPAYAPGDFVLIEDHINLMGTNPLVGISDEEGRSRFMDMTYAYSPGLRIIARQTADRLGIPLKSGVLAAVMGPLYETPSEIRMIAGLGGDLVCMSTIPEVIIANYLGMQVMAISLVSNMAAGMSEKRLYHGEVLKKAGERGGEFARLLTECIGRLTHDNA